MYGTSTLPKKHGNTPPHEFTGTLLLPTPPSSQQVARDFLPGRELYLLSLRVGVLVTFLLGGSASRGQHAIAHDLQTRVVKRCALLVTIRLMEHKNKLKALE